jgi:general secretion pathway protein F
MTTFEYRAINPAGRMLVGTMEASSPAEVSEHLDGAGYMTISARTTAGGARRRSWRERLTPDPKPEDITGFTLDLAMLLKGGVVLNEALLILAQMESRAWLARLIRALHVEVSSGKSLSQVITMHPRLFPPIYAKMIEVAETAGRLEEALSGNRRRTAADRAAS